MLRGRGYARALGAVTASIGLLVLAAQPAQAAAPIISGGFFPSQGPIGTQVMILGQNFNGATAVTFYNGANATTFTVDSSGTQITATVPLGATTGLVSVTTPGGTGTSSTSFTVAAEVLASFAREDQPAASAASGGFLAWQQNTPAHPKHYDAYAKPLGEARLKVNARGTSGALGGIDGTTLVYQESKSGNSDVRLFDLLTLKRTSPAGVNTNASEYRPSKSGIWLLFGRFSPASGIRKVILFDTSTKKARVLTKTSAKKTMLQPGQVSGDYVVWGKKTPKTCNVYLYTISSKTTTKIPNPLSKCQFGPSVTSAGTVFYGRSGFTCNSSFQLWKYPQGGPAAKLLSVGPGRFFSNTYAVSNENTTTSVLYDPGPCTTKNQDIYEFNAG
jgi:IPT/TIG domain